MPAPPCTSPTAPSDGRWRPGRCAPTCSATPSGPLAWLLAVSVGLAFNTVPGLIVAALTPFLLLAALDGHRNALGRNLRTLGRRFWRWLITVVIIGIVLLVGDLSAGLFTFFTRNPLASLVVWLLGGLVLAWFTTAWALIYRSAWAEPLEAETVPEPEPAPEAA